MSWLELSNLPLLEAIGVLGGGGGVNWLLLDRFTTDRAAGAVDGTDAEPGPGVREVTDTSGTGVTIASGRLDIVGIDTFADEGVYWTDNGGDGFARQVGRAVLAISNATASAALNIHLAWANAATSDYTGLANIEYGLYNGNTFRLPTKNVGAASLSTNTDYELVFILRGTGAFLLVDGELMYVTDLGSSTPLWPGLTGKTSPNGLQLDDLRVVDLPVSDATLYPIPVLSDSFNRANGAIGSTDGAGHLEGSTTPQGNGVAYSNATTWTISANTATNTPGGAADNLCYAASGDAEVFHSVKVTRTAGEAGIVLNATDTNNYLRVVHDGTNVIITEVVGGTPNVLATVAKTYAAGGRIAARRIGNTLRVFYDDSTVAEVTPNVALQSNTLHGLYSDSSGNTFDDLQTWPTTGYDYMEYA